MMAGASPIATRGKQHFADMTVFEFLSAVALARLGPSTTGAVAREVSIWTEDKVLAADIFPSLGSLVERGWAHKDDQGYHLDDDGLHAVASFYAITLRVLDRGKKLLDVNLYFSLLKQSEELAR
jgi:hypothetical protein